MGGTVLGEFLGVQEDKWWNKTSRLTTHTQKITCRNTFEEREKESPSQIYSRQTNDMEILVCNWFKGTISLAPCVLHKAMPVQINWYNQRPSEFNLWSRNSLEQKLYGVNKSNDLLTVCVSVGEVIWFFHKRRDFMSLFGMYLFYTWLATTPRRRPGSHEVQESLTALAHQGRLNT